MFSSLFVASLFFMSNFGEFAVYLGAEHYTLWFSSTPIFGCFRQQYLWDNVLFLSSGNGVLSWFFHIFPCTHVRFSFTDQTIYFHHHAVLITRGEFSDYRCQNWQSTALHRS